MLALPLAAVLAAAPLNVAVLYFDNDTGRAEYDVLQKGLADMIVTDLVGVEPLVVLEREKLEAVLGELKLQRSKMFDPKTAQQVGRLIGASHAVTGSIHAVAPKVRIDLRLVEVKTGKVKLTTSVTGRPDDLFDLEGELVSRFAGALQAKVGEGAVKSGHASVGGLLAYSQGLALADQGDLKGAQSKLAEAVRESPGFVRAKEKYAEILKRMLEAEKKSGGAFAALEQKLEAHLAAWDGKRVADLKGDEALSQLVGYRAAKANLAVCALKRLTGAKKDEVVFVPPSQRAALARYEKAFVDAAQRFADTLRELPVPLHQLNPALSEEDDALGEELCNKDLAVWDFATPSSVTADLADFLLTGWTPYRLDIERLAVRPSLVQRDPAQEARAEALFERAWNDVAKDTEPDVRPLRAADIADARAEAFVVLGRPTDALAQWQRFLDAYPTGKEFRTLKTKMEQLMLLSDDVEQVRALVAACDASAVPRAEAYAWRLVRAEGQGGLLGLVDALAKCAKAKPEFSPVVFAAPAAAAVRLGDCGAYRAVRAKATASGARLELPGGARCDEP